MRGRGCSPGCVNAGCAARGRLPYEHSCPSLVRGRAQPRSVGWRRFQYDSGRRRVCWPTCGAHCAARPPNCCNRTRQNHSETGMTPTVYNSAGTQIGSFDADVYRQSDMNGNHSVAVLVTNVTAGTAGTAAGNVPPVGSVIDFLYYGNSGFGTVYSAMPSPSGDVVSYKFVTPFGAIPLYTTYNAAAGLTDKSFFNPFL